jgi:hypothetical protein
MRVVEQGGPRPRQRVETGERRGGDAGARHCRSGEWRDSTTSGSRVMELGFWG